MRMDTDISKKCTECGKEIWPQLATAVIVLIHKGDEVLLVRAKNFRRDFFGIVAGFVETGETLEEAVAREALEETGVTINNITAFSIPVETVSLVDSTATHEYKFPGDNKTYRVSEFTFNRLPRNVA